LSAPAASTATGLRSISWSARPRGGLRTLALALAAAALVLAAGWAGYSASRQRGTDTLRTEANHQLELFGAAAEGVIKRLEPVPATVQLNPEVLELLRQPGSRERAAAASNYLRRLNAHLGSLAVFVLNERGSVLAASDASLVGEDLAYRPYFLEALSGRVGRHFAIDTRSGQGGYFVSHPIHDGARVAGVAAIKINLEPINEAWASLGAPALLADSNQVVILSSEPAWRYTALAELSVEQRVDLQLSRLYGEQRLPRFPLKVDLRVDEDSQVVEGVLPHGLEGSASPLAPARSMLVLGRTLNGMDWRLMMFADLRPVRQEAVTYGLLAALAMGVMVLLALIALQRRRILRQKLDAQRWLQQANAELEQQVQRRTSALLAANEHLEREVAERQAAEQTLRQAQDELVHAGKMAALGQLATGITHELTQPLGAIRTLSGNALEFMKRGQLETVQGNLQLLTRLADQMGGIIEPLKGFARKSQARPQACDMGRAFANALFLYDQRLRDQGVSVLRPEATEAPPLLAWVDANRLEQVWINLVGNALDAMKDNEAAGRPRELRLTLRRDGAQIVAELCDSGPGLAEDVRAHLFEPFFTTKDVGVGLGLGLAISRDIAREAGGELEADNRPAGQGSGACFRLRLPAAPDTENP
jgi:two-component system C4-dicarboxylate transport sensor histidine kinase DctB